ncbi:MAG: ABC transporter permease [Oscillospiraceae bacterium]|nr:ABC transporter permease [Oscillospiraceae bacterium]
MSKSKAPRLKKNSQAAEIWNSLLHRPAAVIALIGCAIILFLAIFADVLVPYSVAIRQSGKIKLLAPMTTDIYGKLHVLGTDDLGRDLLARVIHGARTAMEIGVISTLISIVISTILACMCAMLGGWVDNVIMRIVDVVSCVPGMVVALAICAALGNGIPQLLVALTISSLPMHIKMVRSVALTVAKKDYVESAVALGAKPGYIMLKHLVPNLMSVILINGTAQVSINIMQGATLGFIGLGVKAPTPEWGTMLAGGLSFTLRAQYMVVIPGLVLCLAALSINTLGDCLRDAFDPQLKGKA